MDGRTAYRVAGSSLNTIPSASGFGRSASEKPRGITNRMIHPAASPGVCRTDAPCGASITGADGRLGDPQRRIIPDLEGSSPGGWRSRGHGRSPTTLDRRVASLLTCSLRRFLEKLGLSWISLGCPGIGLRFPFRLAWIPLDFLARNELYQWVAARLGGFEKIAEPIPGRTRSRRPESAERDALE